MELILAAAAFVGTVAIVMVIGILASGSSRAAGERLKQLTEETKARPIQQIRPQSREDSMPTISTLLSGRHLTEKLLVELASAGVRIRPSEFIGIVAASFILSQFLAILVVTHYLGYVLFAAVGIAIPILVLKSLQQKRRAAFDTQIVDALVMMASSLRSGFSFLRAMQMVAQEMSPPISAEFSRAISEVNVGRTVEDSLKGIVSRVKSYDFDLVVTAVAIQNQIGGNLADVLETIAATIRERVRIMGEVRALTAEGKMSGVILVLLPIGLGVFLTITRGEYMRTLFTDTIGIYMIVFAVIMQIVGGLVIKKMLEVDF